MSDMLDIPLVVTNDVHYLNKEDYLTHNAHVRLQRKNFTDIQDLVYPDKVYWFMDKEALLNEFEYDETLEDE